MSTAIEGKNAAGNLPSWIIQPASITAEPVGEGPWSAPLAALTAPTTVKFDCYVDWGGVSVERSDTTKERQRMCQKVKEVITTGETITVTITAVYDQQEALTEEVNAVYAALAKGAVVYIARAFGHDADVAPTSSTVVDLMKATVQARKKNEPTSAEDDLVFTATLSGSGYWDDVALTA